MNHKPEVNMYILIKNPNGNIIGVISKISNNELTVARLDECGSVIISANSDWVPIDILHPHKLKHYYDTFIGKNVENIFVINYNQYKNKYLNK
jgi:hypothetical protein